MGKRIKAASPKRATCIHEARNPLEIPGRRADCSMCRDFISGKLKAHKALARMRRRTGMSERHHRVFRGLGKGESFLGAGGGLF